MAPAFRYQYGRLHLVSNNSRLLILPGHHYRNLGSRFLGLCARRIVGDWPARFGQAMQWHLDELSALVTPGAHAVLIIDRAGWHTTGRLEIPSNITLMFLPPRAPELNPVENIWQFMRDNWLSNRIFKTYDDIVALCCEAWNRLIYQPWKIMSIGRRKWAHGF